MTVVFLFVATVLAAGNGGVAVHVRDGRTSDARRAIHDVTDVRLKMEGGACIVEVHLAKNLRDGVFVDAHIEFDTDNRKTTGVEGFDFGVHAFAGSRFRRNIVRKDGGDPLQRRGTVVKWTRKGDRRSFVHSSSLRLAPPELGDRSIRFRFPMELLRKHGLRYNKKVRWRFFLESTISEHPISVDYICTDDGSRIDVDGRIGDWPPLGPNTADPEGDLHGDATEVDITRLQVDHDKESIYALVQLARRGFGFSAYETSDVIDRDRIVVALEPVGTRAYMKFVEATAWTTHSEYEGIGYRYKIVGDALEIRFDRKPEQTKFRVIAYADARRLDRVPRSGSRELEIPASAWGAD
ncbi:MAG: hypothetical protein AAGD14_17050 [Planctomycetota bacterium]